MPSGVIGFAAALLAAALLAFATPEPAAAQPHCGGLNQPACDRLDAPQACGPGMVNRGGRCSVERTTPGLGSQCGGPGQPSCGGGQSLQSCGPGLRAQGGRCVPSGDCDSPTDPRCRPRYRQ